MKNRSNWAGSIAPYTIVAAAVTVVDYGMFLTLIKFFPLLVANFGSWCVAVVVAYFLHSKFTFDISPSFNGFLGYVAVCMSTLVFGSLFLMTAATLVDPIAAKITSTALLFAVSFALSHLTVFRTA